MELRLEHELNLAWNTILKMVDGFFTLLPNLVVGAIVLYLFFWLGNFTKELISRIAAKAHLDVTLARALGSVCSVCVTLIGLLTFGVIVIPQFSMANVVGGLGISSVAIGFAFKDILQNFFAGMLLLWQKPFSIGDTIKTKDFQGVVQDIRLRVTELRTNDGELALIPNGDIYTNAVMVAHTKASHKAHLTLSLKDQASLKEAREKVLQTVSRVEGVSKDPAPKVYLADTNPDAINFDIYFWTVAKEADMLELNDRVSTALRENFYEAKATAVSSPATSETTSASMPPTQQLQKVS